MIYHMQFPHADLLLPFCQMLRDAGFEPTVSNYAALVRALLLSKDIISATEVLQEMERVGVAFTHTVEGPHGPRTEFNVGQYSTIKALLVDALTGSHLDAEGDRDKQFFMGKQLIDTLYTALVEQVRSARSAEASEGGDAAAAPQVMLAPRIVLDALVEASGRLGMADRAFAIFQDYNNLFDVTPDIHSYNSLLSACAVQRKVNMNAIFTVFQELEASCPPSRYEEVVQATAGAEGDGEGEAAAAVPTSKANGQSFTILMEAMTACRELRVFEQVRIQQTLVHFFAIARHFVII